MHKKRANFFLYHILEFLLHVVNYIVFYLRKLILKVTLY